MSADLYTPAFLRQNADEDVARALAEDIRDGDVTAALVAADATAQGFVICRERAIFSGRPWADAVFSQLSRDIVIEWQVADGDSLSPGQTLFKISGPARQILSGERTALNFIQTLSGTATATAAFVAAVKPHRAQIVDTRKTLPGLRIAQKYAVTCGGGHNHRIGLYDGILIKENHIAAAGGVAQAIRSAQALGTGVPLMCEAETLDEVRAILSADIDLMLVDEFSDGELREAVRLTNEHRASGGQTLIEYSGSASLENVNQIASTGVDRISVGSLTKHVRAIDLSMRFDRASGG